MSSKISVTDRGAFVTYTGEVTLDGIVGAVAALREAPEFDPTVPTVWDFSGAESTGLDADQMRTLAARVSALREGADRARVAVVASRDSDFAGARMFAGLAQDLLQATVSVFRTLDEATAWAFGEDSEDAGPDLS